MDSLDWAGAPKWVVNQQRFSEQQSLRHQPPGTTVSAFRAVVPQAQIVARLDIDGFNRQLAQWPPLIGGPPILACRNCIRVAWSKGVVRIAPEFQLVYAERSGPRPD